MKAKNKKNLKNTIIWKYILVTFTVALVELNIRNLFSDILLKFIYFDNFSDDNQPVMLFLPLVLILNYLAGGIVFYNFVKKAINEDKRQKIQEQNLIYAAIVHDLKTPMTSVQGFAQALADGKITDEEKAEVYDIIYRKSKSMNELLNTLFEYAKYGTEEYKTEPSEIDLSVLMRNIIAENYCDFEKHNIEPELDITGSEVIITADKKELKRALTNLAVNVYKHNPDGINVLFQLTNDDKGNAKIVVADSGNEIPADMDIFEPFVTENTARTIGCGSGLGLAITKRIIERNGGSIQLICNAESYTKAFVIIFPQKSN